MKDLRIKIEAPDSASMETCEKIWNSIAKPIGGLGDLETLIIRLAGIYGTTDINIDKRCVVIFCADNGVVCEGVSQSDHSVTTSVALAIAKGRSNINILADSAGADVIAVDMGIIDDISHDKVINKSLGKGTANIAKGPAMTREEALKAIKTGIDIAGELKAKGYNMLISGEMGIGNTTTAACVASVLTGISPEHLTGPGAGLPKEGIINKQEVVKKAISVNSPDKNDALDVLSKVGGFDIAAMTGLFIGGAVHRVPIIIDGAVSGVAALLAKHICPGTEAFMIASHKGREPVSMTVLKELGLKPVIDANLHLGEGTGAIYMLPILDMTLSEYKDAHRFTELGIENYKIYESP